MHLKSLTLRGFKSFASTTRLELEPGITCVVGPNGSGKSNVVDALAWVMGEQGAKSLRGGRMDDVVFAGTPGRPPLGRAEVILSIDNSDGALPIDYREVTLTRTLFRSGGSEYAINGRACRLLDVQDLLSDSGIGREMHVVVGQGQLDTVLSASPEGRRGLIEEAAGVLKHRKRKEKALRKLDATDANLTRLRDLLGEIDRQRKPLGRQAEVARKAAAVQADARDAGARLLADDLVAARTRWQQEVSDAAVLRVRRNDAELALAAARDEDSSLVSALEVESQRVSRAQETWFQLSSLRERLIGTAGLAAERTRIPDEALERVLDDPDPADLERRAETAGHAEEEAERQVEQARAQLHSAVTERQAAELAHLEEDRRLSAQLGVRADHREGRARLEAGVNAGRARHRRAEEEVEALVAVRAEAAERARRAQHDYTALEVQVAGLDVGEHDLDAEHEAAVAALSDLDDRLGKHRDDAQRTERERSGLAARCEALRLGLSRDGTNAVTAAGISGVIDATARLLEVQPGYETAVAVALGASADSVAVTDLDAALDAITHLRDTDQGRAGLLVAAGGDVATRPALPAGARAALDVVAVPARLEPVVQRLLGNVAVVSDLAAARRLVEAGADLVAVTPDGDMVGRYVAAGGSARAPSRLELQAAHDAAADALNTATRALDRVRFEVARLEDERKVAQRRVDVALARLHESDAVMAATAERLGQLAAVVRAARADEERADADIAAGQQSMQASRRELSELESRLGDSELTPRDEREPDSATRDRLAAAATAARAAETEARLRLRTLEERARAQLGRADALLKAATQAREEQARSIARRVRGERERMVASSVRRATELVLARLEMSLAQAAKERRDREADRAGIEARSRKLRDDTRDLASEVERLTQAVYRDEVARTEHRLTVEQLEQRAVGEFGLDPETLIAEYGPHVLVPVDRDSRDTGGAPYVRAEQVQRLRAAEQALTLLGRINPLALEEFEALRERHAFLARQLDDMRRTRGDLLDIIQDVDTRVEEVFGAAWRDTEREFRNVFSRLFPGGSGRLVLSEPSDLHASGVEIEARPPGKLVKRLSLLSGGERSLVAVAFLVALFKARPSPFYILDEVEAALDDTNLGRLLGIYQELRATSQLVVVTHQKQTMEIADALYGVSMRGDGVSTVISQRLREPDPEPTR